MELQVRLEHKVKMELQVRMALEEKQVLVELQAKMVKEEKPVLAELQAEMVKEETQDKKVLMVRLDLLANKGQLDLKAWMAQLAQKAQEA
jgi:hypothetical protein